MFIIQYVMNLSFTEENYLKAIYSLSASNRSFETFTNEIADKISIKPSTVTDMLRKLTEKKLINYKKYKSVKLTSVGKNIALQVIRKHRLWEVFLHQRLKFNWGEVHVVAEQLEHIQSEKLIEALDKYLGYPEYDPHGDPIPKSNGQLPNTSNITLYEVEEGKVYKVVALKDTSTSFLQYLQHIKIGIGSKIKVVEKIPFDGSLSIIIGKGMKTVVSKKFAENVLVS